MSQDEHFPPPKAHESLQGHLESGDGPLTLNKKKSWFGSLRDAVHKGAQHAKATVDTWRGEHGGGDGKINSSQPVDLEAGPPPRPSLDRASPSFTSTTPLKSPHSPTRPAKLTPRAISSLRNHLPSNTKPSARGRKKRLSVYNVTEGRPSIDSSQHPTPAGPEAQQSPISPGQNEQAQDGASKHTRRASLANSLVGSIRGLGRKGSGRTGSRLQHTQERGRSASPENDEDTSALLRGPSNSIDIPSAPPALKLDLGNGGNFMGMGFGGDVGKAGHEAAPKPKPRRVSRKAVPTTVTTTTVSSTSTPGLQPSSAETRAVTPRDFLSGSLNESCRTPSTTPKTRGSPIPMTTLELSMDGPSGGQEKVFERSVTPSSERKRRQLRSMSSLDALADACGVAHAADEVSAAELEAESVERVRDGVGEKKGLDVDYGGGGGLKKSHASATTVGECPHDMPALSREVAREEPARGVLKPALSAEWTEDDPFAPEKIESESPPKSGQKVELPFRPKPRVEVTEPSSDDAVDGDSRSSDGRNPRSTVSSSGSPRPIGEVHGSGAAGAQGPVSGEWMAPDMNSLVRGVKNGNFYDENVNTSNEPPPPYDYVVAPLFDAHPSGMSLQPDSRRTRATYTAGLGEADSGFSVDEWLRSGATAGYSTDSDHTRRDVRHGTDMSLDSVSMSEDVQPAKQPVPADASPVSTASTRTPSMGNRLEFELKRSQRNMRYNALHQENEQQRQQQQQASTTTADESTFQAGKDEELPNPYASPPPPPPPIEQQQPRRALRFMVGPSSSDDAGDDCTNPTRAGETQRGSAPSASPSPRKNAFAHAKSVDSLPSSLKEAGGVMQKLREQLAEGGGDLGGEEWGAEMAESGCEDTEAEEDPAATPTRARARARARAKLLKQMGFESPSFSPSKATQAVRKNSTTNAEQESAPAGDENTTAPRTETGATKKFSPTAPRDNDSPIRFTWLLVQQSATSSLESTGPDSAIAAVAPRPPPPSAAVSGQGLHTAGKERGVSGDSLDQSLKMYEEAGEGVTGASAGVDRVGKGKGMVDGAAGFAQDKKDEDEFNSLEGEGAHWKEVDGFVGMGGARKVPARYRSLAKKRSQQGRGGA